MSQQGGNTNERTKKGCDIHVKVMGYSTQEKSLICLRSEK